MKKLLVLALVAAAPLAVAGEGMPMKDMKDVKGMQGGMPMQPAAKGEAVHAGTGTVKSLDAAKGTITLAHEPIESIGWGQMVMGFKLKDAKAAQGIKAGDKVRFEFRAGGGQYVVQRIEKI